MKFNFRKIASVIASTVMLSSTVAMAAAANYPAPYNSVADVAVVYGAAATGGFDAAAAVNIQTNLNSALVQTGVATTVSGGDFLKLEKSTNKLNLGDTMTDVYATALDDDELSNVLASGVYEDEEGTEYDYDQTIALEALEVEHFANSDIDANEVPVIGFEITDGTDVLTYTLDFVDTVENSSALLETTYLTMLGREYYISEWDATDKVMTLLDTANTATVYSDGPVSVTVGTTTYEVEIVSVDDTDSEAVLKVNGEEISAISEGNSRKIAEDTYLSVLDLKEATRESDQHRVKFSIGTGQIVLTDNDNLEVNEEAVEEITVDFDVTTDLNSLELLWTADEDLFLVPGMDIIMPGFETIKLSMGGFIRNDIEELSVTYQSDDYIKVTGLELEDGSITLPILRSNSTHFNGIGEDTDKVLVTNATTNSITIPLVEDEDTMFVATWVATGGDDWASYAYYFDDIKVDGAKNITVLTNVADSTDKLEFTNEGDDASVGELTFTINDQNEDAGTATLVITKDSGTAYADRVITKKGLQFLLPVLGGSTAPEIDFTTTPTTWIMNFTEADEDNNVGLGATFAVTLGHSADGPQVNNILDINTLPLDDSSDDEEGYVGGDGSHATRLVLLDDDQDKVDIEYPGEEAFAEVYISESEAAVTTGGAILLLTDAEVGSAKNLIVVGGSCINTVAASLLGSSTPLCGADFEQVTGVGADSFLIETFNYGTSGVATLVAGYNAGDTTSAATYLTTQTVDTTVGNAIKKTAVTFVDLV